MDNDLSKQLHVMEPNYYSYFSPLDLFLDTLIKILDTVLNQILQLYAMESNHLLLLYWFEHSLQLILLPHIYYHIHMLYEVQCDLLVFISLLL